MNYARPNVGEKTAVRVLRESIGDTPQEIVFIEDEHISASFECVMGEERIVIEFRDPCMAYGLMKEKLFGEKLRAANVPIREMIGEGVYENLCYTISKKVRGTKLAHLAPNDFKAMLPSVFEVLLAFASVELSETQGYGWFNNKGIGSETTWQSHLSRIKDEEPGYFFGEWHSMFATTFLERDRFNRYYARMMELLDGLTIDRSLVHGSFSAYTVFVEKGKIAAVCDWQDARFGDMLFDLASLDYWPTGCNLTDMFSEFCAIHGIEYKDYCQRIIAYKYYQAVGSMIYFAKIDNRDGYKAVIEIADGLET